MGADSSKVVSIRRDNGIDRSVSYIVAEQRGGSDGGDGLDAWQQTVETRLSELRADVQGVRSDLNTGMTSLRDRQERDFRLIFGAIIAVALALAGLLAKGFHWIG